MADYLDRVIDRQLDRLVEDLPAVAVEGAKGVGKTASASRLAQRTIALDDDDEVELLLADRERLLRPPQPVLIDEWQYLPRVWDWVRRAVDRDPRPGQFLLTGSATPIKKPRHSGAGRIVRLQLRPLSLAERALEQPTVSCAALLSGEPTALAGTSRLTIADYAREIARSGLPGLRRVPDRSIPEAIDGYLAEAIDGGTGRMANSVRLPGTLRRWLAAYASATATTATYTTILDAATPGEPNKPAYTTTLAWRELLSRLWLLDPLPAWAGTRNRQVDLGQTPKHHLADPALALRLLGLNASALLAEPNPDGKPIPRDGTLFGALFESLATLSLRVYGQPARAKASHLRTRRGDHEVDLVLTRDDDKIVAFEVKLTPGVTDHDVRPLHWLRGKLGSDVLDALVITTGPEAYRRSDGIGVVPLALLGP